MNFYDFKAKDMSGKEVSMREYEGKVILVVNTASKCGLAPQLNGLESMYKEYKDRGFIILGFPCNQFAKQEPGSDNDIQNICKLNYGVTFKMFSKINVNGEDAHPLYKYLKSKEKGLFNEEIKWNFTKFLIDKEGNVVKRYAPAKSPLKIKSDIESLLIK